MSERPGGVPTSCAVDDSERAPAVAEAAHGLLDDLEARWLLAHAFRISIDRTVIALGKSSIHELTPEDVVVPDGYLLEKTEQFAARSAIAHPRSAPARRVAAARPPRAHVGAG